MITDFGNGLNGLGNLSPSPSPKRGGEKYKGFPYSRVSVAEIVDRVLSEQEGKTMGYVHDTHMSQFIAPGNIIKTAGTWTDSVASNVAKCARTANGSGFSLLIPVNVPSNASGFKGARLKSIDLYWTNGTADLTSVATVELEKITLPANASAPSGAAVTAITVDTANNSTAKRITQAAHTMTVTLDAPAWIDDDESYVLNVEVVAAAQSVFTLWGARVNFDLRV